MPAAGCREAVSAVGRREAIEPLRHAASAAHRLFQCLQAKARVQCVGHRPAQHPARIPVHHRAQVGVTFGHRDIGDVRAPHLVGVAHCQLPQQVRIDPVTFAWRAGARLAIDCLLAQQSPQPLQPLAIDPLPVIALQHGRQSPAAQARIAQVKLVKHAHQRAVLRARRLGPVGRRRARHSQQLALRSHVQRRVSSVLRGMETNAARSVALIHRRLRWTGSQSAMFSALPVCSPRPCA